MPIFTKKNKNITEVSAKKHWDLHQDIYPCWHFIELCFSCGDTLSWGNYTIKPLRTETGENNFGLFIRNNPTSQNSDLNKEGNTNKSQLSIENIVDQHKKSHIDIPFNAQETVQNSTIERVFPKILKILDSHQIKAFKVILPSRLSTLISQRQFGKIVTVYFYGINPHTEKQVKIEIEKALSHLPISEQNATHADRRDIPTAYPHITDAANDRPTNGIIKFRVQALLFANVNYSTSPSPLESEMSDLSTTTPRSYNTSLNNLRQQSSSRNSAMQGVINPTISSAHGTNNHPEPHSPFEISITKPGFN